MGTYQTVQSVKVCLHLPSAPTTPSVPIHTVLETSVNFRIFVLELK
jgi:hypothetical protein